jgi:four helix bundle protein
MENIIRTQNDLIVWRKSMDLVVLIYKLTKNFPKEELYGLVSQMRRSAVSIPSNISEGRRRGSRNEFQRFLRIAFGSASELETQLEISRRLNYINNEEAGETQGLLEEVLKILNK